MEEEAKFGLKATVKCYCGKKVKIEYNELSGLKNTRCPRCAYNHLDLVYAYRKDVEDYYSKPKKKWWTSFP